MAETIKVSTDQMRDTVSRFISAQATLRDAYDRMDRAVKVLDSAWKGIAYTAMRTQWSLAYKNIERANDRMQDAIDELNKSAELFDANESGLVGSFQALQTGEDNQSGLSISADFNPMINIPVAVYGPPKIDFSSPFDGSVLDRGIIAEVVYGPPKVVISNPFDD